MPTSSPRPIIVFWMTAVETLSVVARSFTVTPDGTVTGPVGATASSRLSERSPPPRPRPRPWLRVSRAGRAAPVSITTRRRRPAAAPLRCGRERRGGSEPGVPGPGLGRAPPPSLTPGPSTRPPPAGLEPWDGAPERAGADPAGALAADAAAAEGRDDPTGAVGTGTRVGAAATAETLLRAGRLPPSARAAAASSTASPDSLTPASASRRATSAGSSPRSRAISATRFLGIEPRTLPSGC